MRKIFYTLVAIICSILILLPASGCAQKKSSEHNITLRDMTITLPSEYINMNHPGLSFSYTDGDFAVTGVCFTKAGLYQSGDSFESAEEFAEFWGKANPQYSNGKVIKEDDYVYYTCNSIGSRNNSLTNRSVILENNGDFYVLSVGCPTSNEHLLDEELEKIMETVKFN